MEKKPEERAVKVILVPENLYQRLEEVATRERVTVMGLACRALLAFLDRDCPKSYCIHARNHKIVHNTQDSPGPNPSTRPSKPGKTAAQGLAPPPKHEPGRMPPAEPAPIPTTTSESRRRGKPRTSQSKRPSSQNQKP